MNSIGVWFKGLRGKLLLLVALPLIAITGLSVTAFKQIGSLAESIENAGMVRLPLSQYSGEMDSSINGTMRFLWSAYAADVGDERRGHLQNTRKEMDDFKKAHDEYVKLPRSEKQKELFKVVEDNMKTYFDVTDEVLTTLQKGTAKDDEFAKTLIKTKLRPALNPMSKTLEEMGVIRQEMAKKDALEDQANAALTKNLILWTAAISALVLLVVGIFIATRLTALLSQVSVRISDSGEQVRSASEQLSIASQQLSAGATEAASSLEETVSSLEELSSMVKLNADNAKEASSLSQSSKGSAEDGETEIKNLISAMTDISSSSKKIEEIINVIDDIAFQTNLLALNAAVEAARAGEQGKGFAVVAEAVRNLAQRSASAAKDITVLIKESVEKITHGSKIADQSGEVLKNIVTSVKKVADLNNEIASASAEQSNGISQISKAMNELDQATQRNAASAEETAASSEEMSAQAIELQGLVGQLTQVIDGGDGATTTVASTPTRVTRPSSPQPKLKLVSGRRAAEKVIPFNDGMETGRVGTTDGF